MQVCTSAWVGWCVTLMEFILCFSKWTEPFHGSKWKSPDSGKAKKSLPSECLSLYLSKCKSSYESVHYLFRLARIEVFLVLDNYLNAFKITNKRFAKMKLKWAQTNMSKIWNSVAKQCHPEGSAFSLNILCEVFYLPRFSKLVSQVMFVITEKKISL